MKYKAIIEIGGYKIGEEVPTEKALVWKDMYAVPHIEEVSEKSVDKVEEVKKEVVSSGDSILEDYLARGSNVVKKNILRDRLSEEQLKELLTLEKSDKNRSVVLFAINKRLGN